MVTAVDEQVFRSHLEAGPFQSGVSRGKWRLLAVDWPIAVIAVTAEPRDGAPTEYFLRFDCANYPQDAPTARPWDSLQNCPLEPSRWPGGQLRVPAVFRPEWKPDALYLPCDRIAMADHDPWRTQYPWLVWSATSDITLYLGAVHELLNSSDYTGLRSS